MAATTRTLTPEQATALRQEIIGQKFAPAAERLADSVTTYGAETELGRHVAAKAELDLADKMVFEFGGWGEITDPVTVRVSQEVLDYWALHALDTLADHLSIPGRATSSPHDADAVLPAARAIAGVCELLEEGGREPEGLIDRSESARAEDA